MLILAIFGSLKTMNKSPTNSIVVQGGSLRTWSHSHMIEAQLTLKTEGLLMDSVVELWEGPNRAPIQLRVYSDDGHKRPFRAVFHGMKIPNTIAVRNIGQVEFPISAHATAHNVAYPSQKCLSSFQLIQGGSVRTYPFDYCVTNVEMVLKTNGRPFNCRVEIMQGSCDNKQVVELYSEDGYFRPLFCILETPGFGNIVRITNTGSLEFPILTSIVPLQKKIGV